jgi:hypothetical protein
LKVLFYQLKGSFREEYGAPMACCNVGMKIKMFDSTTPRPQNAPYVCLETFHVRHFSVPLVLCLFWIAWASVEPVVPPKRFLNLPEPHGLNKFNGIQQFCVFTLQQQENLLPEELTLLEQYCFREALSDKGD